MKVLLKIVAVLALIYVLFWGALATYFTYAAGQKGLLESNLTALFKRQVSIGVVKTEWQGWSPALQINDFRVAGDTADVPALAFKSMSAEVAPWSILGLWPKLTKFAIEQPVLEVVSLDNNKLQVAGFTLGSSESKGINAKRLISWLLNHQSAVALDGEVVWRKREGQQQRYRNVSFVYQRDGDLRQLEAGSVTEKGAFAFRAQANGDILEEDHWDANFEVLGDKGASMVSPDDLLIEVKDGKGKLQLKTLDISRIGDVILLAGLGQNASWLLDAQLGGRLHDVYFDFSGPILELKEWTLSGVASDVGFKATARTPGMNNLSGRVHASSDGGSFEFNADKTEFNWPKWFDQSLVIDQAMGRFSWVIQEAGKIDIQMENGFFEDQTAKIWDINAKLNIDTKTRNVSSFAQLFKIESVQDLSFEDGLIVESTTPKARRRAPIFADASARFLVKSMSQVVNYFPNDPRLEKLQEWWSNAFLQGQASKGYLSYQGEVTRTAVATGNAQLRGSAQFSEVELDYGYQREWPLLTRGRGRATLSNQTLTISPQEAWLGADKVDSAEVKIHELFQLTRYLTLQGQMDMPLPTAMTFLFDGPLIKPSQRGRPLPINATSGAAAVEVSLNIPLAKVRNATLNGTARIENGDFTLPQGVPVTDASAIISFTERSALSDNIKARFLNGPASAVLSTIKEDQPPVLKAVVSGEGDIAGLEPWVGEHLLSIVKGRTNWQGELIVDGAKTNIAVNSKFNGVEVTAPPPLTKLAEEDRDFTFSMQTGGATVQQRLSFDFGQHLHAHFQGDMSTKSAISGVAPVDNPSNTLMDRVLIQLDNDPGKNPAATPKGVNFLIDYSNLDLDAWVSQIIDLARLDTKPSENPDTAFLDAMRSVRVNSTDPTLFGRKFGPLALSAVSADGGLWIGSIEGDNINGTLQAEPRAELASYGFRLQNFNLVESTSDVVEPDPIDFELRPEEYISLELSVDSFSAAGKRLGKLRFSGAPSGDRWQINDFLLQDKGIETKASGGWVNNQELGSISSFDIETKIDEAGGVLDEMDFSDLIKKGNGALTSNINWLGAPHEFDFARLNGDFHLRIKDGELMQVEAGAGKLIGLLNFNSIARRITLDFRDVFSSGLTFDRMVYSGVLANGEAIMRDAFLLSPAAFVRMEGKINLNTEHIDMEVHVAPDIAGNLTLLSALANPTAGALMFLTQQIFKDQMRSNSMRSYRALGSWEEFELEEFEGGDPDDASVSTSASEPGADVHDLPSQPAPAVNAEPRGLSN